MSDDQIGKFYMTATLPVFLVFKRGSNVADFNVIYFFL